jgi:cyclophilin family peptidyl-prolyl cis-trans isomerase
MCNKRRTFTNINMIKYTFFAFWGCLFILYTTGCASENSPMAKSEVILTEYPELAEKIVERNTESLLPYTNHEDQHISRLAWRAIAQSRSGDLNSFVDLVISKDSDEAWFALSMQPLEPEHLRLIMESFEAGELRSASVCRVFYRHGDMETLDLLMKHPVTVTTRESCALAVSGIINRVEISDEQKVSLFRMAFEAEELEVTRNLVYGFYRMSAGGPLFIPAVANEISRMWDQFGVGQHQEIDKYMVRILGQRTIAAIMNRMNDDELERNVQLSIELAKILAHSNIGTLNEEFLKRLMNHSNPHVRVQVLEAFNRHDELIPELLLKVEKEITGPTRNHELFVHSLALLKKNGVEITSYKRKLDFTRTQNPYLLDRILPLYKELYSEDEYYQLLLDGIEKGEISGMHSMRALGDFWRESRDAIRNAQIRRLIYNELDRGERSVVAGMQQILMDDDLIFDDEYNRLREAYTRFIERGERDNFRMMEQILEGRFPDLFVKSEAIESKPFLAPNWQRLYDLGTVPYWVLETEKGTIEVRLNPLSAPFTVSSIDSLTRAGVYDGVLFHRVVKNFVIQGGDFDRWDGFGGPGYRIPTEPSFDTFERSAAGIASSGTDTEGSQFFFMHEWAPHLDGSYTNFGSVVRGMDVVDRIQIGDRIKRARISIR